MSDTKAFYTANSASGYPSFHLTPRNRRARNRSRCSYEGVHSLASPLSAFTYHDFQPRRSPKSPVFRSRGLYA